MNAFEPICWKCGAAHRVEPVYTCLKCGGSLDIRYDYERIFRRLTTAERFVDSGERMWRYRDLLPILPHVEPVTLGEGDTPLLAVSKIPNISNIQSFYMKMESVNPTLAFKDRPLAVALTAAKQFDMKMVMCASTGNTGVAAAAYAARAGLRCTVFVPEATPQEKLAAMEQYGADLQRVKGSFSEAYERARLEAIERNGFNLTSTYMNPYAAEGNKTVAYELAAQLGCVPDWIIVPIGAGPLLAGIYKGFREMKLAGWIDKLPRMAGVQVEDCAPIVQAYLSDAQQVLPWKRPIRTAASGIADPLLSYPADGTRTLSVIRESGGAAVAVTETELIHYRKQLAVREGVLAELSSVTAIAAVDRLLTDGSIQHKDTVVAIVTGHGLKDMTAAINR